MENPETLLTAILLTPLVSAVVIALFLRRAGKIATGVSVAAAGVILALSLYVLLSWDGQPFAAALNWMSFGNFSIDMGFLLDAHTATMLFVVSFVGFWIHVFSVGYMADDGAKARFFGGLSIFMFSMLGIVFAGNLIMIFVFWELVGFSSYMLISHYCDKGFAAAASKKAFITNRVGDFGFLIGIIWTYWAFGTTNLAELEAAAGANSELVKTGMGLLLMCGFLGKSAQFPLHVWLTDAMAGPTPVSALIHAATMVAAGVFLMVRIFFMLTPEVLEVVLWLCTAMTVFAGFCALGQSDIKKTLAYSTLSHLGFMGVAIGLGYPGIALMHMAMHAFFKATLFLCSGSVIHACHHEQDMFKMGGLLKKMPITGASFIAATLAIVATPFFSGFYSKDSILAGALLRSNNAAETGADAVIFYLLVLAAALTAIYMGRMLWVVFFGKPNSEHAEHAHESSLWMTLPLIVLGLVYSIGGGWFTMEGFSWLGGQMSGLLPTNAAFAMHEAYNVLYSNTADLHGTLYIIGLSIIAVGFVGTFFIYGMGPAKDTLQTKAPAVYHILNKHGWFDDFYDAYVAKVQQRFADFLGFLDLILISGLLVRGAAGVSAMLSMVSRSLHTGSIHGYVFWFFAGVAFFAAFAFGIF